MTFAQDSSAIGATKVFWEIVEFIGVPGSDNEMIVRSQTNVTYDSAATEATGTVVSGIVDDSDAVVFITGQMSPDGGRTNFNAVQSTSAWSAGTDEPVFTRNDSGGDAVVTSYAVVEFVGSNWIVQRSEHTFSVAGNTETDVFLQDLLVLMNLDMRYGFRASGMFHIFLNHQQPLLRTTLLLRGLLKILKEQTEKWM